MLDMQLETPGQEGTDTDAGRDADQIGDPACWLARVCTDCGRLADARYVEVCVACGADLPDRG